MDKEQDKIISQLAIKYNISKEEVTEMIKSPFKFMRTTIMKLDFSSEGLMTQDEFEKIKGNFNLPSIGKLHTNYYSYLRFKNKNKDYEKKNHSSTN